MQKQLGFLIQLVVFLFAVSKVLEILGQMGGPMPGHLKEWHKIFYPF